MKKYQIVNYYDFIPNQKLNKYVTKSCLAIAKNYYYHNDEKSMEEALFGRFNTIKEFVVNDKADILGYLLADYFIGYQNNKIMYIHEIVLDKSIQGKGLAKELVTKLIIQYLPDVIVAKTQNPKCFELLTAFANITYYPNLYDRIPQDIYELVVDNPFMDTVNEKLICKNEYAMFHSQKYVKNNDINKLFMDIGDYDAQVVVVVLSDDKLNLHNKILKK